MQPEWKEGVLSRQLPLWVTGVQLLWTALGVSVTQRVALLWLWEHPRQGKPEVEVSLEAAPPTPASLLFS